MEPTQNLTPGPTIVIVNTPEYSVVLIAFEGNDYHRPLLGRPAIYRLYQGACLRKFFWVELGFLWSVSYGVYKTNPNPTENYFAVGKSGPNATFNLFFLGFGLGWPWVLGSWTAS